MRAEIVPGKRALRLIEWGQSGQKTVTKIRALGAVWTEPVAASRGRPLVRVHVGPLFQINANCLTWSYFG